MRLALAVFSIPMGPPFKGDKCAIHREPVQYGRRRHRIEHLTPLGRYQIRRDDSGADLNPFGDDLEEVVGMFS